MLRRNPKQETRIEPAEKVLEVDASMQGTLTFKDPVNLRINGNFEGILDTKGTLSIGEKAVVKANIRGEAIQISGEVIGDVRADREIRVESTGRLIGDVETPRLSVAAGAVLQGKLTMIGAAPQAGHSPRIDGEAAADFMNADQLAAYLAVEKSMIFEWADEGKLPGVREGAAWKFEKRKVDEWVASGRIK